MPTDSSRTPFRILLVEDDVEQAHLVKFLLEDGGQYVVTLVQDGVRGTHLAESTRWDLVITDLNLPGVDGLTVVETSRRHRPNTPILATTGDSGPEYGDRALRVGANEVLMKPLDRDTLLARVAALIAGGGAPAHLPPPAPVDKPTPLRVLAFSVRPGDAEAGCGGTLLRHRDEGDRVVLLTLTHGLRDSQSVRRREAAKAAGRKMGIRFFVTNAGSGDASTEEDIRRLVEGALIEIRPDIVYLPTRHHINPHLRAAAEAAIAGAKDEQRLFAYDPGDAGSGFRPDLFLPVGSSLEEKVAVLGTFGPSDGEHLVPDASRAGSRLWARHAGGQPAEPFESIRGTDPFSTRGNDG
jgi:CheY-like chemotaxis protein/LmbE family N-acetylglucosaminyl deacetylase